MASGFEMAPNHYNNRNHDDFLTFTTDKKKSFSDFYPIVFREIPVAWASLRLAKWLPKGRKVFVLHVFRLRISVFAYNIHKLRHAG
jgi:hypothetical protein